MKIPISDFALLDLDAPTVPAYAIPHETGVAWGVWCKYCEAWHAHGIGEGHREAHCSGSTPYVLGWGRPSTAARLARASSRRPAVARRLASVAGHAALRLDTRLQK